MSELYVMLAAKGVSPAQAVRLQALDDYPNSATKWMNNLPWSWPKTIPLDEIDFSNKKSWNADGPESRAKIKKFKKKMVEGKLKPAILVRPKGEKKYVIADGHHRALSALELGRPLLSWTVDASEPTGGWDKMHDQEEGQVKASNVSDLEIILNLAALLAS